MSSCFLCDCSYKMTPDDRYSVTVSSGVNKYYYMKYMPIMIGSSGLELNRLGALVDCGTDQQHTNDKTQNYVSYSVKKIEFRASCTVNTYGNLVSVPEYIILFKVPFRLPVFDYYFTIMKNFILYSEPESVLKYGVYSCRNVSNGAGIRANQKRPNEYCLIVDKPFIVGPNDYVGVLYMFTTMNYFDSSAKVWFDVV